MHAVLRLRVVPGHEETWDRVFVSILDITGRRRAEEQRVELAVQRERVGILTDFIEGVSHEFNTPLSIIHSGLYLLERAADPAKRAAQLARLEEQASYLGELVEAMLTMSRLDSEAEMTFKPVNLNSLLRDVETRMRALADENQLALTVNLEGTLPTVQGDGAALHRALTNLVENAVQYTPPGGSITVEAGMQARDVVVTIRDTGIGISDEDLPRIFERFYRGDRARSSRGAGLGLPIVRKIVEMHGGCIEIESAPGEGSVFRVRLPLPE